MKPRLILVLLAMLFVFAQFVSIEQTTNVMSCIAELDDVDDLSLEDVVPVDPFLAPPDAKPTRECLLPPIAISADPAPTWIALADSSAGLLQRLTPEKSCEPPGLGLWLINRTILI